MSYLQNFLMQLECLLKLDTIKREDTFHGLSWNFFMVLKFGDKVINQSQK